MNQGGLGIVVFLKKKHKNQSLKLVRFLRNTGKWNRKTITNILVLL